MNKEQINIAIESLEELNEELSIQNKGTLCFEQWELLEYLKQAKKLTMSGVSQQRELLLSAICQFTKRNTQKEIQEVEKWIETDFRK
tara:strand:+ start:541 stop:801 length:261 start_codon:yes stop_codon:yes gene_type:complete